MRAGRLIVVAGLAALMSLSICTRAQEPTGDKKDKKIETKISPDARAELSNITAAYKKLSSMELAGTLSADFAIGGQSQKQKSAFTSTFAAPDQFRHEMKGDLLIGSTGEKIYVYRPARNDYKLADAPKQRVPAEKFPNPMRELLQMQNVALMCALVDDAGKFLADGMTQVTKAPDATLEGRTYLTLDFKGDKMDYRLLVDPKTHFLRQVILDLRRSIEAGGRDDVEKAVLTFDYTTVQPDAKVDKAQFVWAPPQGAKDAGAAAAEEGDATALVGKDAPDFTLNGMDGKPVSMKEQHGSVVVLDFWATWCGPCRASLPGLNKIYKDFAAKGMKAYAVDLEESKDTIQPVASKLIPDVPVLLDEKSEVSKKYGVSGIPQTVVIGKDGKIKKVFIGSGNESNIKSAVEKALAE